MFFTRIPRFQEQFAGVYSFRLRYRYRLRLRYRYRFLSNSRRWVSFSRILDSRPRLVGW